MTAKERNDFECMCELINEALKEGHRSVKIGNEWDGKYYERLALEHPKMIKKRTGLEEYWTDVNTNCGISYIMYWEDTEELKVRKAIQIIQDWREQKNAELYGFYGWDYDSTGSHLAQAIDDNRERIEKACDIENLGTYSKYISGREKYSAAWTLPGDDWEEEDC